MKGYSMTTSITKFAVHLQEPLYRNGYALVLSSAVTSGLGVVYWIFAARFYETEMVGLNSAALSAMMFLAGAAQFNLVTALNRFLPRAGKAVGNLIKSVYIITSLATMIASLIYILGINLWSPTLNFLTANPFISVWFVLATVAWCIFVLQDGALTGLRQAAWVPLKNAIFSLVKVVLLVIFASVWPQVGILVSWTLSAVLVLLPFSALISWRLIPQHVYSTEGQSLPIVPSQIAHYIVGNYIAHLLWLAMTTLLPILVLQQTGAKASAYYYLCQTIANSLYLVSSNMGMSLITEVALDQTKLEIYSLRILIGTARLVIPAVVIILIGAPYILLLFGKGYVTEGTTLLRLLSLSAIPNMVTSLYMSVARVQRQMKAMISVLALLCALTLSCTFLLLKVYGITGVGVAQLMGQIIIATMILFTKFRSLWLSR